MGIYLKVKLGWSIKIKNDSSLKNLIDKSFPDSLKWKDIKSKIKKDFKKTLFINLDNEVNKQFTVSVVSPDELDLLQNSILMISQEERIDDTLDYYLIAEDKRSQLKYLNHDLFGFERENKVLINGFKELSEKESTYVRRENIFDKTDKDFLKLRKSLLKKGFDDSKPFMDQVYSKVPAEVMNIALFLGISKKALIELRPTLIIYES